MKLTLATFDYVKEDGTKPRKLLILTKPTDTYLGVEYDDEAELDGFYEYLAEKEALDAYLKHKYHLESVNYKRFKADKIEHLTESKITVVTSVRR